MLDDADEGIEPEDYFFGALREPGAADDRVRPDDRVAEPGTVARGEAAADSGERERAGEPSVDAEQAPRQRAEPEETGRAAPAGETGRTEPAGAPTFAADSGGGARPPPMPGAVGVGPREAAPPPAAVDTPAALVAAVSQAASNLPSPTAAAVGERARAGAGGIARGRAFGVAVEAVRTAALRRPRRGGGRPPITDPVDVDPVPEATRAIAAARDTPFAPLTLPAPIGPPGRPPATPRRPAAVRDEELGRPTPPAPDPKEHARSRAARTADRRREAERTAAGGPAAQEAQETATPRPIEPPVLLDLRVAPAPKVDEKQAGEDRKAVQAVVARLKADVDRPAKEVARQARLTAGYGELLQQELDQLPRLWEPVIGDRALVPEIVTALSGKLDELATSAGVAADVLADAVLERRRALVASGAQVSDDIRQAVTVEAARVTGEAEHRAGEAEAADRKRRQQHLAELKAALHSRDPRLVTELLDERLQIVTDQVARGTLVLNEAAARRAQMIDAYTAAYIEAYRLADDAAQAASNPPQVPLAQVGQPWLRHAEGVVRGQMNELKRAIEAERVRRVDALATAGLDAKAQLRDWADTRLRRDAARRDREAERQADIQVQRDADSAIVRRVEQERARDDLVAQIRNAKSFHDLLQAEAAGTLTEGQRALLEQGRATAQVYLRAGDDPADPLSAVATHLLQRLRTEKLQQLAADEVLTKAIKAMPAHGSTDELMSLGRVVFASQPPDADSRVSSLSAATREKYGTDEPAVYKALDNLDQQQVNVLKALYEARFDESLYGRLDGELTGNEWKRAKALMNSDQAMAVAAAIRYEQNSIFLGPDRDAVLDAVNTLPPGQAQAMRDKFKGEYHEELDAALTDVMRVYRVDQEGRPDTTAPDDRGSEQVQLVLQINMLRDPKQRGDPAKIADLQARADAIELDRAMRPANGAGKAEAVDAAFTRIRNDVARTHPEWTQAEVDTEVRRRNAAVERAYGDRFRDTIESRDPQLSPLRQVIGTHLTASGEKEIAGAMLDVDRDAEIRARLLLADRGAYAADSDVNAALQANYDRAADEVRRSRGPEFRAELRRQVEERRASGRPMTQDEIDAAERDIDRRLETLIDERATTLMGQVRKGWKGPMSLDEWVRDRTQWGGEKEANWRLAQGGKLTRAQEIYFAVRGWGMDREQALKGLEGRTPDEIKAIAEEFRGITGEDLSERLRAESSGRTRFDVDEALRGIPLTAGERMAALTRRYEYERGTYFSGSEKLRDVAVAGNLDLLDRQYAQAKARYERLKTAPESLSVEDRNALQRSFTTQAGRAVVAAEEYRAAVDRFVDQWVQIISTAVAITVGVALGIITGGAALPLVALAASLWGTAMTMITKTVLLGDAYGIHEYVDDLVVGSIDAAFAAATAGLGDKLLGVAKVTGATSQAIKMAAARAAAQRAAKPVLARIGAQLVEQVAGATPSALVGNLVNRQNWRGDAFKNIVTGSAMQVGIGIAAGSTMNLAMHYGAKVVSPVIDSINAWRGKVPEAAAIPRVEPHVSEPAGPGRRDSLAARGTPAQRTAAFAEWRERNPGGSMRDFLRALDEGVAVMEANADMVRTLQRDMRTELLAGLPPQERGAHATTPITVLSDAEFTVRTGSQSKGQAAVLVVGGEPHVVVREGAPLSALREEGLHLQQLRDPAHAAKLPLLDERRLAMWKDLPVEERMKSWHAKLELEVEAQGRLIADLERRQLAQGSSPVLEHQLNQARRSRDVLAGRLDDLLAHRQAGGVGNPPGFLDEPSRLFAKVDEPPVRGPPPKVAAEGEPEVPVAKLPPPPPDASTTERLIDARVQRDRKALQIEGLLEQINEHETRLNDRQLEIEEDLAARLLRNPNAKPNATLEARAARIEENIQTLKARHEQLVSERAALAQEIDRLSTVSGGEARFEDYGYKDFGKTPPCFAAGTAVHTPGGTVPIEGLEPGDLVASFDPRHSGPVVGCVTRLTRGWTQRLVRIELDGDAVWATPAHPVRVRTPQGGDWRRAADLRPGDRLQRANGADVVVARVGVTTNRSDTYNIEVAETHVYYVGRCGVLVHNGDESAFQLTTRQSSRIYAIRDRDTGKVIYVGKTFQGEPGDVLTRFQGHLGKKEAWRGRNLEPVLLREGNWTRFETACWEQHYLNEFGGLRRTNPSSLLENDVNVITKRQFDDHKYGFGHNPCAGAG